MRAISDEIWDEFGQLTFAELPADAVTVAKQCILDWFGCALAGSQETLSHILQGEFGAVAGPVPVIGTAERTAPSIAALLNGTAGHALAFDDTSTIGGLHSSSPVMPAAFSQAVIQGRSGADLLTALVVGAEVSARFGAVIGPEHYRRGWHSTSSIGIFGATAAAGWLLGLDHDQFGNAVGIAASHSNGLQANFGTMAKPMHAGRAAEGGYVAARLAAQGFTANKFAFEGATGTEGLASAASSGDVHRERLAELTGVWAITSSLFKYHAACFGAQATIESTLAVLGQVDPAELVAVEVRVPERVTRVCKVGEPATGMSAKYSLPCVVAMALLGDDTSDLAVFNDARVTDAEIRDLLRRVTVVADDSIDPMAAELTFRTSTASLDSAADLSIPATDLVAQGAKLTQKFANLARPVLGADAEPLARALLALDRQDALGDLPGVPLR